MTAFLLKTVIKDWTARVFLLTLGVFWTLYLFPALTPGGFGVAAWDQMHLLLIPIVLFSLRQGLGRGISPSEKHFWNFMTIAFGLWFVVRLTYLLDLPKEESLAGSVITGALYVGVYLAILLAVNLRPHIEWPREELRRHEQLESYATVTLAMGVLVYFVLLPRGLHRGVPEFETLARAMFLSLDLFLLFRFLHVRRFCNSVRWRTIYLLLAGSMGLWGVVDLVDLLNETGLFTRQSMILDLMFDLGFLTTLLAARAHRLLPADERPGDVTDLDPDAQLRLGGRRNLLLTYAVALPAMHGLLVLVGWFDPAALPYREFVVLLFLAVLGILAFYDRREIEDTSRLVWEQYLAERSELIQSEGKFRDLFENSNDLIQSVRADGSYEYVNPAWQDAMGYREEDLSSLRFLDVIAPEERAHCEEMFAGLQKGESFAHVKTVFLAKNGRRVFVEGSVSAQMRRGDLIATRGFFQDVTGHKRAEEARDASDARFRVLFESSPYGLVIVNEYGLILLANPEMEAMFGYSRGELNGKTIESLMPARYQAGHIGKRLAYFDNPVARPVKNGLELYALKRDGTEFPVEIALGPFKTESGTLVTACITDVTKSKEAGDALKKSEERYRELVESSPGFIGKHDLDGTILSVNTAMAHNLGYEPEEMIGKNGELFLGPPGQKGMGRYIKLLMKNGSASGRVGLRTREGGERIWEYRCVLHRENGSKPHVLGYAQDITERHRAERELRKMTSELEERVRERTQALADSEAHFRHLFERNPHPMWVYDLETLNFLEVNHAAVHHYGYSRDEFLKMNLTDIRPPEDIPRLKECVERVRQGLENSGEWTHRLKDGNLITVNITSHSLTFAGREARLVVAQDVTSRKTAEQMLRDSEAKLLEAQRIAQMGNWDWDIETNVTRRSGDIYRIFGIEEHEMEPTPEGFLRFVHPDDRDYVIGEMHAVREGLKPRLDFEYRIVRPDGSIRWLQGSAEVVARKNGKATRLAGVVQDRTEQRELLSQLQQAQKMEVLGKMAGGVAHDFNNLLMVIGGHTEILRGQMRPAEESAGEVEEIQKAVEKAGSLTQQLLAFSRKQDLQMDVINVNDILAEMRVMMQRLAGETIDLNLRCQEGLWYVKCDKTQMQQVILNLVANARDAMPGGGELTVETANLDLSLEEMAQAAGVEPGKYALLSVSDAGEGMDAETRARVFEPFFTTKPEGKGTGLGLATVYGIIQQSCGAIRVVSEPRLGTAFQIYLPRTEAEVKSKRAGKPAEAAPAGGEEVILLVEDEGGVRRLARGFLEGKGYRVLEAYDGKQALEVIHGFRGDIHLLLTDVVMPRMGGPELVKHMSSRFPDLKVLFISGYPDDAVESHGAKPSAGDLLAKPFALADLGRRVRETLDARPRQTPEGNFSGPAN